MLPDPRIHSGVDSFQLKCFRILLEIILWLKRSAEPGGSRLRPTRKVRRNSLMLMERPLRTCHFASSFRECQQQGLLKSQLNSSARATKRVALEWEVIRSSCNKSEITTVHLAARGRRDQHCATASTTCPIIGPPTKRPKKSHQYAELPRSIACRIMNTCFSSSIQFFEVSTVERTRISSWPDQTQPSTGSS